VKITVQQEINEGAIMQQSFEVEYVQNYHQCPDCAKSYTHNTWRAVVQVRQKVPHKRTFLYLEQLILKHSAHKDTINIKEVHDGIDFFFAQRNHAEGFIDFLKAVAPVHVKKSQELISHDIHTSTKSYKFSYSAELVPICKDDLVVLPLHMAKKVGNINPMTICHRVGTSINLLDPTTLQTADVSTEIFWRAPFRPLADVQDMAEFIVLDIEPLGTSKGRWFLAEATVARASDLGTNDQTYYTRTHLGGILHVGDSVMGYHMTGTNFNNQLFDALEESKYASTVPDVVLVKKHYARKKKGKSRNWRVKRMAKEEGEMLPRKQDQERVERDFEMFLRDVEEDAEMRAGVALYKAEQQRLQAEAMEVEESEIDEDEGLEIPMDQLLDDMEDLTMQDQ
jgi:nonsense-mediated mRNA decay protein 3